MRYSTTRVCLPRCEVEGVTRLEHAIVLEIQFPEQTRRKRGQVALRKEVRRKVGYLVEHATPLQSGLQVVVPRGPAGAHLGAYHPVRHYGVSVPPMLHSIVQVDQAVQ